MNRIYSISHHLKSQSTTKNTNERTNELPNEQKRNLCENKNQFECEVYIYILGVDRKRFKHISQQRCAILMHVEHLRVVKHNMYIGYAYIGPQNVTSMSVLIVILSVLVLFFAFFLIFVVFFPTA